MAEDEDAFERVAAFLAAAAEVRRLFPTTFDPVSEAARAGVERVALRDGGIFKVAASYDPEENTVELDRLVDVKKLAAAINRRHPSLAVTPEEALLFAFLHELGHARRRKQLLAMPRRNGLIGPPLDLWDRIDIAVEEEAAESYAKQQFLAWRKSLKEWRSAFAVGVYDIDLVAQGAGPGT